MSISLSYAAQRRRTRQKGRGDSARIAVFPTELGWIGASWEGKFLGRLTFGHRGPREAWASLRVTEEPAEPDDFLSDMICRLERFAGGNHADRFLDVELATDGMTPFQQAVTQACRQIPVGRTRSYSELAEIVGHPRAARAVGNVMARNRFALIVPCHRVVAATGALGGFSSPAGISMKERLLKAERLYRETSSSFPRCDSFANGQGKS